MKQTLIGIFALIALVCAYTFLPLEWRRHKDIERGNTVIANIEAYRQQHGKLPPTDNAELLTRLGIQHHKDLGWQPDYQPLSDTQYRIRYRSGYSPPWLTWDTQQPQWRMQGE